MNREEDNNEINLMEILYKLWAYKFFIISITFIFILFSIINIIKTEKIYTSSSIFIPAQKNTMNPFGNTGLSPFSSLLGISNDSSSTASLIERFRGREFVLELADQLKLSNDRFFNSYDPKAQEPSWKTKIKSLINYKSSPRNSAKVAEWTVLQNFNKHIKMTETSVGAIKVSVSHFNPQRAAEIANYITNKIISVLKSEKVKTENERLNYLSERLADSLINVENAEEELKKFLLSNSTAASTSFYQGSIILDSLRTQRDDTNKQISTTEVLLSYVENFSPTYQDYAALRNKHPLLDQSDFRRILGISETISAWSWPTKRALLRVRNSLLDRAGFLDTEIRKYENEVRKDAISAEQKNKLTRELKIAESTYKVLTEQVKSQSLVAGFTPDTSRIIAAADAEHVATEPKTKMILALAATSGFFVSAFVALLLSWNKGVFYSSRQLVKAINPKFHHKIRSINYYRSSSPQELQNLLIQRPAPWLKQLFLETSNNRGPTLIIVADTTNIYAASVIAQLLAVKAHEFGKSLAHFDLSKTPEFEDTKQVNQLSDTIIDLDSTEIISGYTEYTYRGGKQNADWLFAKSFEATLNSLKTQHDTIILSAASDVLDLLHASEKFDEAKIVLHVSVRKTSLQQIQKLKQKGIIEVALLS